MEKSLKINTILNIIRTCCSIMFPLITFPYISRILQPESLGKVNFAQSFVSYFILIAGLGISTYAIRECGVVKKDKDKLGKLASQLYSINIITTVIAYIFLIITIYVARNLQNYKELIFIESTVIIFITLGTDWLNSAMEDFKYITIRSIFFQIISLVCMFVVVKNQDDYYKYAIISVLTTIGPYICNIIYRKKYCKIKFTFKIDLKKHMMPIILLFVMMLSQTIFNNVDITMLGLFKGDYEVGLYSVAYKIVRIISQVVQSLSLVIIPRLSYCFANNDFENANKLLRKVLSFNIALGLPCVVGVILLAPEIVYIVCGTEFMEAVPIIRILILTFMFSLVGGSFLGNAILIPMKKEKYYMIVCLITALVNVFLNAMLIPKFSAIGASIATACNGLLILILLSLKKDKKIKIEKIKDIFIAPILGCIIIAIVCLICSNISSVIIKTLACVIISCCLYTALLLILKYDLAIETFNSIKNKLARRIENDKF